MRTTKIKRTRVKGLLDAISSNGQIFQATWTRRTPLVGKNGTVLQPRGALRKMTCIVKRDKKPTKDWSPSVTAEHGYDYDERGLYKVYTTEGSKGNDGRGNHWAFICLRSLREVVCNGHRYEIID